MPVVKEGPDSRHDYESPTAPPEVLAEVIAVPRPVAPSLSEPWLHILLTKKHRYSSHAFDRVPSVC